MKNGVKIIQATAYNGARTVPTLADVRWSSIVRYECMVKEYKPSFFVHIWEEKHVANRPRDALKNRFSNRS